MDQIFSSAVLIDGDKVWVKASASYTEVVDLDDHQAAWDSPIVIEGFTDTEGDGGKVTIDGGAARASGLITSVAGNTNYVFKNFIIQNHTSHGVDFNAIDRITWKNCEFIDNGTASGAGILCGVLHSFEECKFNDNTLDGVACQSGALFVGCEFMRNTQAGVDAAGAVFVLFSNFFSNGEDAVNCGATNDVLTIMANCTVDGDGKDTLGGLAQSGAFRHFGAVINSIFYDCTTGIEFTNEEAFISRNNLLNANTGNYSGGAGTYTGEVTAAPSFTNEVAGADYSLTSGSPAKSTGFDASSVNGTNQGMDIGAVQRIEAVGSGLMTHPGTSGGMRG